MNSIFYINQYIKDLNALYKTGVTTEPSYRPALCSLFDNLTSFLSVNEQKHLPCGAPDISLLKNNITIAYIECKDIDDNDLDGKKANKEQFDRYKKSLDTILFTNHLDFHLYEKGLWKQTIHLAEIEGNVIVLRDVNNFLALIDHIKTLEPQSINSSNRLATIMAGKAGMLRDIIKGALESDLKAKEHTLLTGYMEAFRNFLIKDLDAGKFADVYAQTIVYGLFAARLHDKTPENFSRMEAAELIPKSNPFLRKIFQDIAGFDLDERIAWIVDDLVATFRVTNIKKILSNYGKNSGRLDPLMNFYEDFLSLYDPKLKKSCGVFYTPQPVVRFIVNSVDDILKSEFDIIDGLASSETISKNFEIEQDKKKRLIDKTTHRVQVLDPATGTGTFLVEVIKKIKESMAPQIGAWNQYVDEHLIPRIYGFEIMMAPYTIAHLKFDLELNTNTNKRFRLYLTDSLEEYHEEANTLFSYALAEESIAASRIKKDTPIMVMLGNPPYNGKSKNKGAWITKLMKDYKLEPGGEKKLDEKNSKWINNDYCKFIRLGQYYVDKNKEGILAYITDNSFLDNNTYRGMRWSLMRSFDKIYIINLHGHRIKDNKDDENIFDIQEGVSINIFVKTKNKKDGELADVYYTDVIGSREYKKQFLTNNNLFSIKFDKISDTGNTFYFVKKNKEGENDFNKGFKIDELFKIKSVGVVTSNDDILVADNKHVLLEKVSEYYKISANEGKIEPFAYRPFDFRYIYYDTKKIERSREKVMLNFVGHENVSLVIGKQCTTDWRYVLASDKIANLNLTGTAGRFGSGYTFPLFIYQNGSCQNCEPIPNIDPVIWSKINDILGYNTKPIELFNYIYGVLFSPNYRFKYNELLKDNFPCIPYPSNFDEFEHFMYYGEKIKDLHLFNFKNNDYLKWATFTETGDGIIKFIRWDNERVFINDQQYFDNVPATAWFFFIGGYQPAQKWLIDRENKKLTADDTIHYAKIIYVLIETDRLMREIDMLPIASNRTKLIDTEESANLNNKKTEIHYHIDHMDVHDSTVKIEHLQ